MSDIKLSEFPKYMDSILNQLKELKHRVGLLEGAPPKPKKQRKKPKPPVEIE